MWLCILLEPGLEDKGAHWVSANAAALKEVAQNYKAQHGIFPHPSVAAALLPFKLPDSSHQQGPQDIRDSKADQSSRPPAKRACLARNTAITLSPRGSPSPSLAAPDQLADNLESDRLSVRSLQRQVTPTDVRSVRESIGAQTTLEDLSLSGYLWDKAHGQGHLWIADC